MAERYSTESMGETAENVAERYGVSREDQDAFALESHRRAVAAQRGRQFDEEIVTVDAPQPKGAPVTVHADEGPRPDTTLEKLAKLQPVFREGGTVTAGNSSQINDGAACLVLASDEGLKRSATPSRSRGSSRSGAAGVDPAYMGVGPVPAMRKALERAGLTRRRPRPGRAERGVRRAGARLDARAGHPAREAERQRRRDRARSPARLLRRPPA